MDSCAGEGACGLGVACMVRFSLLMSLQSVPQPGEEYALFAGGVKGKFVSLSSPKEFVQTWALSSPTWPSGARLLWFFERLAVVRC